MESAVQIISHDPATSNTTHKMDDIEREKHCKRRHIRLSRMVPSRCHRLYYTREIDVHLGMQLACVAVLQPILATRGGVDIWAAHWITLHVNKTHSAFLDTE